MAPATADDWRFTGQERYLQGVNLKRLTWAPRHPDNDHDHCAFCTTKLTLLEIPESIKTGYCTTDMNHWVCPECFQDFKERFKWVVIN